MTQNKDAPDTLIKWDARVGADLKDYDIAVEKLPLATGEDPVPMPAKDTTAEDRPEDTGPEGAEEIEEEERAAEISEVPSLELLQESGGGCQGLDACNRKAKQLEAETTNLVSTYEKCDKTVHKLSSQLSDHITLQAATQGKLTRAREMGESLALNVDEAADEAADATIKASKLKLAAKKLVRNPSKVSETKDAVEKASKAHADQVLAQLRVTEATSFAELS